MGKKIFIVLTTIIFVILTVLPWIPYDSYETIDFSIIMDFYQSVVKQLIIGLILILIVVSYGTLKRKIYLNNFRISLYIAISLCIISGIIYCVNIYNGAISIINLNNLEYYKSNSKNSYYELDLSGETNSKECIFYSPTLYYYENTVIYLDLNNDDSDNDNIMFYRDLLIDKGNSFMVLTIDNKNNDKEEIAKKIITIIKDLKSEYTIGKAILMGETEGADMALFTEIYDEYNSKSLDREKYIDGVFAIYPSKNIYKNKLKYEKIKSPTLFIEGNSKSNKTVIRDDNKIRSVKIPGSCNKLNDKFIKHSIIGNLLKKEILNYIERYNL